MRHGQRCTDEKNEQKCMNEKIKRKKLIKEKTHTKKTRDENLHELRK